MKSLADIRKDYILQTLQEEDVATDPIEQFNKWWDESIKSEIIEANAMTLATANTAGIPSARTVLLKAFSTEGFIFFTNYESQKGEDLAANPNAALLFFWKEMERQVRIEGKVEKISEEESDAYFNSRPLGSRIGAWASPQSKVINDRTVIEDNVQKFTEEFGEKIPRPPHWGGYLLVPVKMEFWQGRSSRLHDRILFTREDNSWKISRLAP